MRFTIIKWLYALYLGKLQITRYDGSKVFWDCFVSHHSVIGQVKLFNTFHHWSAKLKFVMTLLFASFPISRSCSLLVHLFSISLWLHVIFSSILIGLMKIKIFLFWLSNRCVASYMARMGQCFSTSLDAVGFATSEDTYHDVEDDVETPDRKYCFSDGVGKISEELAAEVWWIFILLRKKGRYSPLNTSPLKHKVVQWCKPLHVRRMEIAICNLSPFQ